MNRKKGPQGVLPDNPLAPRYSTAMMPNMARPKTDRFFIVIDKTNGQKVRAILTNILN